MTNDLLFDCDSLRRSIIFLLREKCSVQSNNRLKFLAGKVCTLEKYLSEHKTFTMDLCLPLLFNLEAQNQFLLENESCCIFSIQLKDILVIDDSTFIFTNPSYIKEVDCNGILSFNSPFSRTEFCSPEILALKQIPASVTRKTFYYSLGALLIYCITKCKSYLVAGDVDLECLKSIRKTKLYWTILRLVCLEPSKRSFLYV